MFLLLLIVSCNIFLNCESEKKKKWKDSPVSNFGKNASDRAGHESDSASVARVQAVLFCLSG